MWHHCTRLSLRLVILSLFLGLIPPATTIQAKAVTIAQRLGPPSNVTSIATSKPVTTPPVPQPTTPPRSLPAQAMPTPLAHGLGSLPLAFVPNTGQTDAAVRFHARGLGGSLFFTSRDLVMQLPAVSPTPRDTVPGQPARRAVPPLIVHLQYQGGNPQTAPAGVDPLSGRANVLQGNDKTKWRTNLTTYAGVRFTQLYTGIDLSYAGTFGQLKSTYTVAPGADPARIRWRYIGAKDAQVDTSGNLLIALPRPDVPVTATTTVSGTITEHAPSAWQQIGNQRVEVAVRYVVAHNGTIGFSLGTYDHSQPLIIDPAFSYQTYLGGYGEESAYGVAVDRSGQIYVTGTTTASSTFPTSNALQSGCALYWGFLCYGDIFVAKLTADGSRFVYSTYLGGSTGQDIGRGIAVDSAGNAYITGQTNSDDFPTTSNAYQPTFGGNSNDVFVTKLNANGSALLYSTYLGAASDDYGYGIALDGSGNTEGVK